MNTLKERVREYADSLRHDAKFTRGENQPLDNKSYINMLKSIADEIDKVLGLDMNGNK